jgi:threonine/homoserine efflux transporter RhtA
MDSITEARRSAAAELQALAEEFERSDAAALRRTRILCWTATAVVTLVILIVLIGGADWRYLGAFWAAIVGLVWIAYWLSSRRQREQTDRLRALASRWLGETPRP